MNTNLDIPLGAWLDQRFKELLPPKTVSWSKRPEKAPAVKRWLARHGWKIVINEGRTRCAITRHGVAVAIWRKPASALISPAPK